MTKPIIKWVGGKTQLLKEILPRLPATGGRYYEAFIGGAAVFLAVAEEKRYNSYVINDFNPELVNLYTVVRDDPKTLMWALDVLQLDPNWKSEEFYYRERATVPPTPLWRAARFIYLNKCGFNGLWRVNRKGENNVPWGKPKNPTLYDKSNLLACSQALQGVEIRQGDFSAAVQDAQAGDVCYFDPPYVPVSKTSSFTSYAGEFNSSHQEQLAQTFRDLVSRGVVCLLSNSDAPLVRELYQGFEVLTVSARRAINRDASKRGAVNEVLVCSQLMGTTTFLDID